MTTPAALRELADRLEAQANEREADFTPVPTMNPPTHFKYTKRTRELLHEAATQLRTAAGEGGEALPGFRVAEINRDIEIMTDSRRKYMEMYDKNQHTSGDGQEYMQRFKTAAASLCWDYLPMVSNALASHTHPPEVARDAGRWGLNDPDRPKWEESPAWANYLTMDRSGEWTWWAGMPVLERGEWKGACRYVVAKRTRPMPEWYLPAENRPKAATSDAALRARAVG